MALQALMSRLPVEQLHERVADDEEREDKHELHDVEVGERRPVHTCEGSSSGLVRACKQHERASSMRVQGSMQSAGSIQSMAASVEGFPLGSEPLLAMYGALSRSNVRDEWLRKEHAIVRNWLMATRVGPSGTGFSCVGWWRWRGGGLGWRGCEGRC